MRNLKNNLSEKSKVNGSYITYEYLLRHSKHIVSKLAEIDRNTVLGIYIDDIKKKSEIITAAIISGIEFCIIDSLDEIDSSNVSLVIADNVPEIHSICNAYKVDCYGDNYIIVKVSDKFINNSDYIYRAKATNNGKKIWLDISRDYIVNLNKVICKNISKKDFCFNLGSENKYLLPVLIYVLLYTRGSMQIVEDLELAASKKSKISTLILNSNQLLLLLEKNIAIKKDIIVLNDINYINCKNRSIKSIKNIISMRTFFKSSFVWEIKRGDNSADLPDMLFDEIELTLLKDAIILQKNKTTLKSAYQTGLITLDLKKLGIRLLNQSENSFLTTNIIGRNTVSHGKVEFLGYSKRNEFYDRAFVTSRVLIKLNCIEGALLNTEDNTQVFAVQQKSMIGNSSGFSLKKKISDLIPDNRIAESISVVTDIPIQKDWIVDFSNLQKKSFSITGPKDGIKKVETKLERIVAETLKMNPNSLNKNSNFFDVGGNSLSVIYLLHAIEDTFKERLTIKQIFSHPTIEGIATEILNNSNTEFDYINSRIIHKNKNTYSLSPAERQMYSVYMREPNSTAYNLPFLISIDKRVKNAELISAINTIYKANDTLHTKFINTAKGVYQEIVVSPKDLQIPIVEMNKSVKEELHDFIKPFNLKSGCLMRSEIAVDNDNKRHLLIDFHHIAVDGVSLVTLFKELSMLLNKKKLLKDDITYGDYADWISNKNLEKSKQYWINSLSDTKNFKVLRTDYSRENNIDSIANTINKNISNEVYESVKSYCRKNRVTEFMFWISMFGLTILDYSKTNDIVIGTPIANRNKQTQDLVGMFVNVLPIKIKTEPNMSIGRLVESVKNTSIGAFANSFYQVDSIVSDLGLSGSKSASPLFQASFSMQNMVQSNYEIDKLDFLSIPNENTNDLTAFLFYKNSVPTFSISYKTSLYKKKNIIKILNNLLYTVDFAINNDNKSISELFENYHFNSTTLSMKDIEEDKNLSNLNFDF